LGRQICGGGFQQVVACVLLLQQLFLSSLISPVSSQLYLFVLPALVCRGFSLTPIEVSLLLNCCIGAIAVARIIAVCVTALVGAVLCFIVVTGRSMDSYGRFRLRGLSSLPFARRMVVSPEGSGFGGEYSCPLPRRRKEVSSLTSCCV